MTSGAHASAREIVEQLKAHRHPYISWADVEDRFTAIVEAYGQAVERETREQCATIAEGFHCPDTCEKELFKGQYEKELKDHECLCESVKIAAAIRGEV